MAPPPLPDQNPNSITDHNTPHPQSPPSSLSSDIKQRLKSPPRRLPTDHPPPPPPIAYPIPSPASSLDKIRKQLGEFRLRNPNPNPHPGPSFQELFKNNNPQGPNLRPEGGRISYDWMRDSLRQFRPSDPQKFQSQFSLKPASPGPSLIGDQENLPDSGGR